ncbi:hypothetical protein BDV09DRAFT_203618 [Aspergillus tetrazonus]
MPDQEPALQTSAQPAPPPQTQAELQLQQTTTTLPNRDADFARFKNYAAYTFLFGAPILIALPPRKLDHLTVLLTGAFAASANHITRERTGQSILDRLESRISRTSLHNPSLPSEKAREIQARIRAEREKRMGQEGVPKEEMEMLKARRDQDRGMLQTLWMGDEEKGWKEKRIQEEREALAAGKGYGDLIREHIWDVWTWGGKDGVQKDKDQSEGTKQ